MIIRLILLFLIVAAVLWLLKRLFSGGADESTEDSTQAPQDKSENMLQCKFCGIHTPESSTVTRDNLTYCCQDHADSDQ